MQKHVATRPLVVIVSALFIGGCISNSADTATPAPTNLTGMYKSPIFGGSIAWHIREDGTGVSCEERTSMSTPPKVRDIVVNGDTVYDVFEFKVVGRENNGIQVEGIMDLNFKQIDKMPAACNL